MFLFDKRLYKLYQNLKNSDCPNMQIKNLVNSDLFINILFYTDGLEAKS